MSSHSASQRSSQPSPTVRRASTVHFPASMRVHVCTHVHTHVCTRMHTSRVRTSAGGAGPPKPRGKHPRATRAASCRRPKRARRSPRSVASALPRARPRTLLGRCILLLYCTCVVGWPRALPSLVARGAARARARARALGERLRAPKLIHILQSFHAMCAVCVCVCVSARRRVCSCGWVAVY